MYVLDHVFPICPGLCICALRRQKLGLGMSRLAVVSKSFGRHGRMSRDTRVGQFWCIHDFALVAVWIVLAMYPANSIEQYTMIVKPQKPTHARSSCVMIGLGTFQNTFKHVFFLLRRHPTVFVPFWPFVWTLSFFKSIVVSSNTLIGYSVVYLERYLLKMDHMDHTDHLVLMVQQYYAKLKNLVGKSHISRFLWEWINLFGVQ